ncbi:MAG: TIGR00266 family protein [Microcoleaceae cyanobacterium]
MGTMTYMEEGIQMQTGMGGGGHYSGFKRMFTGESFFITTFVNGGRRRVSLGFAATTPGQIIPLDLGALGGEFICQKDAFLCAASGTDISVAFTRKLGAGFFGGEGFILQRLRGDGLAFIQAGGAIVEKNLAPGETLRIDTGCLVAFSPSVRYDIQFVGGFRNALFGGEGLFLAQMTGPGQVFIQSLPFSRLADRIGTMLPNLAEGAAEGATGTARLVQGLLDGGERG